MREIKFADIGPHATLHEKSIDGPDSSFEVLMTQIKELAYWGEFIGGSYLKKFSRKWAETCNATYCVPLSSGSAALKLALRAYNRHRNSVVIVPAMTFAASAMAAVEEGYNIIYCDVDENGLIDWSQCLDILEHLNDPTTIVMPVHLYGQDCKVPYEIHSKYAVLEDACQAHGVLSSVPDVACYSFYPSKNLGAWGDAGALVTNDVQIYEAVSSYSSYGDRLGLKYDHEVPNSGNYRMDNIQACVLLEKLSTLNYNNDIRVSQAFLYAQLNVPSFTRSGNNVYHQYPILVDKPAELATILMKSGIETGRHYPYIVPSKIPATIPMFNYEFPGARLIADHCLSLPIGPQLSREDIIYIVGLLHEHAILINGIWHVNGNRHD